MGTVTIKKEVETMQMVEISSKNIDGVIREGKTYLYFTADVKVCRINVTDDIALGERFQIKELPTLLVFREGMKVHTVEGIVLPEYYTNLLKFY